MKLYSLASGSSGNAYLVYSMGTALLLDAGLSGKKILEAITALGSYREKLQAIIISHEHCDHIRGAGVLSRRLNLPLYITKGTWAAGRNSLGAVAEENLRFYAAGTVFSVGSMQLTAFALHHDSREPAHVVVDDGKNRLAVLTDTGMVDQAMADILSTCDGLVLEANHDPDMLASGPYPPFVKRRIISDKGHLSNQQAARLAANLIRLGRLRQFQLGHLSAVNNTPRLAASTVLSCLRKAGLQNDVQVLPRDRPGPLLQL